MSKAGGEKTRQAPHDRAQTTRAAGSASMSVEIELLLNTLRELAAIRSTAEDAAAQILDSAEGLLTLADREEAEKAQDAIMSIMTACGFHDLVGQRVTKITKTLDHVIAARLGDEEPAAPAQSEPSLTLEGPRFPSSESEQARIDALFGDNT